MTTRSSSPPRRPNILFVMIDDQTVREMGCYGNRILQTPNAVDLSAVHLTVVER